MKKEYDFSQGERGKFYRSDIELQLPVYLEPDVAEFLRQLAEMKNKDINVLVNEWLRQDISLLDQRTMPKNIV